MRRTGSEASWPSPKDFHTPGKTILAEHNACWYVSVKSQVKSPAHSLHQTSPVSDYYYLVSSHGGYHSHRPAWCPRPNLVHHRRRRQWARRHRVWDIRHWRHCIFTDESRFKLHHTDGRARVDMRQSERHIDVCVQGTDGNVGPTVIIWAGVHHGGKSELVVLDVCYNKFSYPGQEATTLFWSKIMLRPTQP